MANAAGQRFRVENSSVTVWGVKKVESITDKQAVLSTEGKMVLKGSGLSVSKLDLDAGSIVLTYQSLDNIDLCASKGRMTLRGLLK
ncbi:MAG: YabP/YqfC family sporulation protein [Clostridia bacterium]|nr:YabP/YqfC family sporulation protein [Clostridia bacterium]